MGYQYPDELQRSYETAQLALERLAAESLELRYAGQTAEVIDGATGEVRRAQVFVAVLGASNYTYAEARWTQSLPD